MAKRHYDVDVRVVRIADEGAFEAALFDGSADVLIEHLEFLYEEAAKGKKITMFCAPSRGGGLHLVVPHHVRAVQEFRGKTMAVRTSGQPHAVTLWLRMMGLERDVATVMVSDGEIGRWGRLVGCVHAGPRRFDTDRTVIFEFIDLLGELRVGSEQRGHVPRIDVVADERRSGIGRPCPWQVPRPHCCV
jgi:hypothetical protein